MTDIIVDSKTEIERNWAMLAHLLGILPMPLVNILGPFLIWLIKKEGSSFVEAHAKEAVNFQITVFIALIVSAWLCFIVIGFFLVAMVIIADLLLVIMAAFKAKQGESFRYPVALRFF